MFHLEHFVVVTVYVYNCTFSRDAKRGPVSTPVKSPALCLQRTQTQGRATRGSVDGFRVGHPADHPILM
jgi:hypothetical protein